MIINLSKLRICDNSGVKSVKCFKIYKTSVGGIGSVIYVSVKDTKNKGKLQKGYIVRAIIVRNRKMVSRFTGSFVFFDYNEEILLHEKHELLVKRIFCTLPLALRKKGHLKPLSLASIII
jgi:large subunit ribosomal protein L14